METNSEFINERRKNRTRGKMINRVTGEIGFQSGLRILPHCVLRSLSLNSEFYQKIKNQKLSINTWTRHILGIHTSEHGTFEVEALSTDDDRIYIVLLSHRHPFYDLNTTDDSERRAFHEGVVSTDLGGQKEFTWGEVICRLEPSVNKDWLVIAYHRESGVPFPERTVLLRLFGHENMPDDS